MDINNNLIRKQLVVISSNWIKKYNGNFFGYPQWKFLEKFGYFFKKLYFLAPVKQISSENNSTKLGINLNKELFNLKELPYFEGTTSQLKKSYLLPYIVSAYVKYIKKADVVFIFNRDLFSTIGLIISKILNKKTVLFVGDIWEKSVQEKYKSPMFTMGVKVLEFLQKRMLQFNRENSLILATINKDIKKNIERWGITYFQYFASLIQESDIYHKKIFPLSKKEIINILYVGWLIEAKGVQDLIEAISLLQTEVSNDIRLYIIGDGYYKKNLQSLSNEKKVEAFFYGFIGDREELKEIYRKCDIFVLPSYAEGYPKVVFEAASQGNLVITSDIVELDMICLKYRTKDSYALKELLKKLITNYDVYKSQINQQYKVIRNYTLEKSCTDIYNKLKDTWFLKNRDD